MYYFIHVDIYLLPTTYCHGCSLTYLYAHKAAFLHSAIHVCVVPVADLIRF